MPGVTPLGLRYPLQGETVTAQSYQNLASDIDTLMSALNTMRLAALRRPSASISQTVAAANTSASSAVIVPVFNVEDWDTDARADLAVNNDRINLTSGIWQCRLSANSLQSMTNLTHGRVWMITGAGGTQWQHNQIDTLVGGIPGTFTASGLVLSPPGGTYLRGQLFWQGTGGPATWSGVTLQAAKIRELSDM